MASGQQCLSSGSWLAFLLDNWGCHLPLMVGDLQVILAGDVYLVSGQNWLARPGGRGMIGVLV